MNNLVTVIFGATEHELPLDGRTIGSLRTDPVISHLLGLSGGEVAEVDTEGDGYFDPSNDNTTLYAGDTVRFTRRSGDKG